MKSVKELLKQKRNGVEWSAEQMQHFVDGVVSSEVSLVQVAAFLMAACTRGLSTNETAALTLSMAQSGERIQTQHSSRPVVDKHSTGGVADKVSLLLAPLATACGLTVPMISGRGLGHTGGTVDKLESIPGFRTNLTLDELHQLLDAHHLFMSAQNASLVPADRILYSIRDVTGTVENVGLLTASILSKKIAEGLSGLVMDVKVGRAAFMKTFEQAAELAESLRTVARLAGLPICIVFTRMDVPLGRAIGNWVEVVEAESALRDHRQCSVNLLEVTVGLCTQMVLLGNIKSEYASAREHVLQTWESGRAHQEFHGMIARQGGNYAKGERKFTQCKKVVLCSTHVGTVVDIDAMTMALGVMEAGGGRLKETDVIDPYVGIVLSVDMGTTVGVGSALATVSATTNEQLRILEQCVYQGIRITKAAPNSAEPPIILDKWC